LLTTVPIAMLAALLLEPADGQQRQGQILFAQVKGAIGVASTQHVCGVIAEAGAGGAEIVILEIDTPGGLLSATRELIQCVLGSARPVVVYVAPSGARAASAGTYIAQAAHIAAMARGTHLGAATPVALGLPGPLQPIERREDGDQPPSSPRQQSGADQKVINDAVAYLKGLAQLRGRNAEWAEKAVREAATLTATEALTERVVDILADDMESLLRQLHGRTVQIGGGSVELSTAGAPVVAVEPGWRLQLLAAISDPNIAFILLMIGFYGILFEFWSPGAIVPGVVGGICLILAFMALSVLPLSYGALGLVLLGLGLMTAEAFVPGVGILGIGGLVAFVVGAIFLFDPEGADFDLQLAWPVVLGAAATSVLLFVVVLGSALKARGRPPMTGAEEMIGLVGQVITWDERAGTIRAHGEIWGAESQHSFTVGDAVRVVRRDGLSLIVEPAQP
jgi:membrane-bound serine protease (ClpP class)